jgi:hypothetical protein
VAWLMAGLWSLLIFVTVPFVRAIQEAVTERLGARVFLWVAIAVLLVAAAGAVVLGRRLRGRVSLRSVLWLGAVLVVFIWWSRYLYEPVEAIHFVEYGVLGVLVYLALRHRAADQSVFLSAALVVALFGTVDEIIQWVTPSRVFDYRDLVINAGAGSLVQIALWQGVAPAATRQPARPGSLRLPCRLAIAMVLVLGLCLSATPQRLDRLATRAGWMMPLATSNDVMAEYGYRHVDPDIGTFRSRLTLQELHQGDQQQAAQIAAAIREHHGHGSYERFLQNYSAARAPLAHEVRVHIFARDRNLHLALKNPADPDHQRRMTVACRENQILQKYFPTILEHSGRRLGKGRQAVLDQARLLDEPFTSKVSIHLITIFSEGWMRAAVLLTVALLLALDLWLGRRSRRQEEQQP